jgi:hypothetical protein
MAKMNAIEDADGEEEWTGKGRKLRNRTEDFHENEE